MGFVLKTAPLCFADHSGLLKTVCCFESAICLFKMRYWAKFMILIGKKTDFAKTDFKMSCWLKPLFYKAENPD